MINNTTIIVDNTTEIIGELVTALPSNIFNGLEFVISLAKVAGILVIIYLAFLIIKSLFRARAIKDIRKVKNNLSRIDHKMDRIIELLENKNKKRKKKVHK